jgi:hypothetical protein
MPTGWARLPTVGELPTVTAVTAAVDLLEHREVLQRLDPGVDALRELPRLRSNLVAMGLPAQPSQRCGAAHGRTWARSRGSAGSSGGAGCRSSRYSMMASDWVSTTSLPAAGTTSAGT